MKINVLSCFDGLAGGRIALERAGIEVNKYYAFEIDKYSIKIAQKNYPDIIHLGDINQWREHDIQVPDLIVGGSPCQGFSNAGAGLSFDDPRSKLFFVFAEIVNYWKKRNPNLKFMLENVKMKAEWQDVITEYMGVEPILINSALVSAQNRNRLYWTNIEGVTQPEDRGIVLRNILEDGFVDREKNYCIDSSYHKGGNKKSYFGKGRRQLVFIKTIGHGYIKESVDEKDKYPSLCAQDPSSKHLIRGAAKRNQVTKRGVEAQLNIRKDEKSNCVVPSYPEKPKAAVDEVHYRKLTPLECELLQTLDRNYTFGVSNTQRYKMIGNGFTIDVVAHVFSFLPPEFYTR